MTKGSNAVDEAFRKQMETEAAQAQIAENSIKALNITLGTGLLPIINDLLKSNTHHTALYRLGKTQPGKPLIPF